MRKTEIEKYGKLEFKVRPDFFDEDIVESEVKNYYDIPEGVERVVDIGAHIGGTAVYAASQGCEVWAFEPEKNNFNLLKENVRRNNLEDRVHCIREAIGKEAKRRRLYLSNDWNSGNPTLKRERAKIKKYEYVSVISLRHAFEKYGIKHCDFLKIDCEGCADEFLFEMTPEDFEKIDIISMEFHGNKERIEDYLKPYYKTDISQNLGYFSKKDA